MDEKILIPLISGGGVFVFIVILAVVLDYFAKRSTPQSIAAL